MIRICFSLFVLLFSFYILKSSYAQPFVDFICHTLALITFTILSFFNAEISLDKTTIFLNVIEQGIDIAPHCSALPAYFTLISLVLFEARPTNQKIKMIIFGFVAIQIINVIRLCLLFYSRIYLLPPTYSSIHEIYFLGGFIVLIIAFYLYWSFFTSSNDESFVHRTHEMSAQQSKPSLTRIHKFALTSIALFIVFSYFIQPYTKYALLIPTNAFLQLSTSNWESDVQVQANSNRIVVTNAIYSSRNPINPEGEERSVQLSNRTSIKLKPSPMLLLIPILLAAMYINGHQNPKHILLICLIPIILESLALSLLYVYNVHNSLKNIAFPAVVLNSGIIMPIDSYSYELTKLLKHSYSSFIYAVTFFVPIIYWRHCSK